MGMALRPNTTVKRAGDRLVPEEHHRSSGGAGDKPVSGARRLWEFDAGVQQKSVIDPHKALSAAYVVSRFPDAAPLTRVWRCADVSG